MTGFETESLLSVVIDRLRLKQSGPLASVETGVALTQCENALEMLEREKKRTANG